MSYVVKRGLSRPLQQARPGPISLSYRDYIYIYICTEREGEREICIYIYI